VRFVVGTTVRCESLLRFCACLFGDDCVYDLYVCSEQAISLMKATERIIADGGEDGLRGHVARLEENSRLRASLVELQVSADKSADAVIALR
jgi:hypothetical protein